uniref:RRP15-like protein n=1 Tax=Globodera rostochiensis TaxID=31243 RepID=A0A914I1L6_GLORO
MATNLSFSVDLEQLEKEIQTKEANSRSGNGNEKLPPDLSGHIGGGLSSQEKRRSNVVGLDADFDTLDEPIWDTINRDLKLLCGKFGQVLFPAKSHQNVLADWDLWGPLFICVGLSILLQGVDKGAQFTQIFSLAFFGTCIVTLNAKLLGGKISFFQALCCGGTFWAQIVREFAVARVRHCIRLCLGALRFYIVLGRIRAAESKISVLLSACAVLFRLFLAVSYFGMDTKKVGYVKPNYGADREKERKLQQIATRGVTQLFNAVAERQSLLERKVGQMIGQPRKERKRIIEQLKKHDFAQELDMANVHKRSKKEEKSKEEDAEAEQKKEEVEDGCDGRMNGQQHSSSDENEEEETDNEVKEEESDDGVPKAKRKKMKMRVLSVGCSSSDDSDGAEEDETDTDIEIKEEESDDER